MLGQHPGYLARPLLRLSLRSRYPTAILGRGDWRGQPGELRLVLARDQAEAIACANRIAPEHLHLSTRDPAALLPSIENAGAIFLGHHTPVALGDYVAGPSHVLPTGGTARFASGLCANDFLRRSSVIQFSPEGLRQAAADVQMLAGKEGLTGHYASVDIRLRQELATTLTPPLAGSGSVL